MKEKFTKSIAKDIARNQFNWTLDCILGHQDPDYTFNTNISEFEQNFTEDLEERNIIVTSKRIQIINSYYEKMLNKGIKVIEKLYNIN